MAIQEAVINIRLVLENLKATKDLSAALAKIRKEVTDAEKNFTKLKRSVGGNAIESKKAAKEAEALARALAKQGRELLQVTNGATGLITGMSEMTDAMVAANNLIEEQAQQRKLNIDASLEEKKAVDQVGSALHDQIAAMKALDRARRASMQLDAAKAAVDADSTLTDLEKQAEKDDLDKLVNREGFTPQIKKITTDLVDGEVQFEDVDDDERAEARDSQKVLQQQELAAGVLRNTQLLEDEEAAAQALVTVFNKLPKSDLTEGDSFDNRDLKNYAGTAEALSDALETGTIKQLEEMKKALREGSKEYKLVSTRIEELTSELDSLTKSTRRAEIAQERIDKKSAERRNRNKDVGLSERIKLQTADRQKEVDLIAKEIKQEEKLGKTQKYYSINSRKMHSLEIAAREQLNEEIAEAIVKKVEEGRVSAGAERINRILEERIEKLKAINLLLRKNKISQSDADGLKGEVEGDTNRQLTFGETFKANLNEPAMRAARAIREVGMGLRDAGRQGVAMGVAMTSMLVPVVKDFAEFNQEVTNVVAVFGGLSDSQANTAIKELSESFLELGERTEFTANQIAGAAKSLALAGFSVDEVKNSIEAVTNLASAGNVDLEQAAGYFANITRAFDVDTNNAQKVADVLATVATNSNTTIETLGESFKFIAPIASATGQSLEEVSTALGVLGNAGISASRAGTGLSRAFSELLEKEDDFATILEGIGSSYDRIDPTKRTITEIVNELERLKSAGLLDTAGFFEMFDQRSARAVLTLVNQGADSMEDLGEKAANSAGNAAEISSRRLDTLSGDALKLKSAMESLKITFGSAFNDTAREFVQSITYIIKSIRYFIKQNKGLTNVLGVLVISVGVVVTALGSLTIAIGGATTAVAAFQTSMAVMASMKKTVSSLGLAFRLFSASLAGGSGVTSAATAATASLGTMGVVALPLIIAITAIVVALGLLYLTLANGDIKLQKTFTKKFTNRIDATTDSVKRLGNSFRDVANSIDLIRKLPDLNLGQLKTLSKKENLFTIDMKQYESDVRRTKEVAARAFKEMTDLKFGQQSFNTTNFKALFTDLGSNTATLVSGIGDLLTLKFSDGYKKIAKGAARNTFGAFMNKTVTTTIEKDENGINAIFQQRNDALGKLRKYQVDIADLTKEEKKAAKALLATYKDLEKLEEIRETRAKFIAAFEEGRLGFEKFKTEQLREQEKIVDSIAAKTAEKEVAVEVGDLDAVSVAEKEIELLEKKKKTIEDNVKMANRMLKSSEKELEATTALVNQEKKVGAAKAEANKQARALSLIIRQLAGQEAAGIEPTEFQLFQLEEQIELRDKALEKIKDEVLLESELSEKLAEVTKNEKIRLDLIKEGMALKEDARDKEKKLNEELEDSKPVRFADLDGDGVDEPLFRTDKEERELQTKRAKEERVGNISPEDIINKIQTKTGKNIDSTSNDVLDELKAAMDGTSEFGVLGDLGKIELAERLEKERLTAMSTVDGMASLQDKVNEIKKNISDDSEIANAQIGKDAKDREAILIRQQDAQARLVQGQVDLALAEKELQERKEFIATNGKAIDDRINEAKSKRLETEQKLDDLQKNKDDKEATKEVRKRVEEEKKEEEKKKKEREKDMEKRKKVLEDAKFEDKKRELKMAKLKKDKNLEEKLTAEVAKMTRERAADAKFGTDEELKKLKKDTTLSKEQQVLRDKTINAKKDFLKKEEELFKQEQLSKKAEKKDEQIEDLNKKAQKTEEKRLSTQEKIRDAMLKQAKTLKDFVLITKFLNRQEAIRRLAQERARQKAVGKGASLDKALKDPKKSNKQKQELFSKAAATLRRAKELGVTDLELQNIKESLKRNKNIMTTMSNPANTANNKVNQNGQGTVQGGVVNNVSNPNVIFNLAGIKDPDEFMSFISDNAPRIAAALFTQGGKLNAKNQGKNKPQAPKTPPKTPI